MDAKELREFIDLLVMAVDGCLFSEGCFFGLDENEQDKLMDYMKRYTQKTKLDLLVEWNEID